jgi:DNA-binding transcriptional regulator YiaG
MSHPNRSRAKRPGSNPKPAEIAQLREEMELTQTELADLLYVSLTAVQKWESGERRMQASMWEYLCLMQAYPEVQQARRLWLEGRPF